MSLMCSLSEATCVIDVSSLRPLVSLVFYERPLCVIDVSSLRPLVSLMFPI